MQIDFDNVKPTKIISGYVWGEIIGRGTWGKVRQVTKLTTNDDGSDKLNMFAVKILYRSRLGKKIRNGVQLLYEEFSLVKSLLHPNVIQYYELDDTTNSDKFYLFMELCSGGTISCLGFDSEHQFSSARPNFNFSEESLNFTQGIECNTTRCCNTACLETKIQSIKLAIRQLLTGLDYLHRQNVSHHDIKNDNILLDENGNVKICDFGVAERFNSEEDCCVFFGTPAFQSPEIVSNRNGSPFDGRKADVWATGVILFNLLTGDLPYSGATVYLLMKSIEEDPVPFPNLQAYPNLDNFLKFLLEKDPGKRPTASELLNHPLFHELDN